MARIKEYEAAPEGSGSADLLCISSVKERNKVLLAGYYWNGTGKPSYYGAVFEHLDDDLSCEGAIGLKAVSDVAFEDDGNAIAWAIRQ